MECVAMSVRVYVCVCVITFILLLGGDFVLVSCAFVCVYLVFFAQEYLILHSHEHLSHLLCIVDRKSTRLNSSHL